MRAVGGLLALYAFDELWRLSNHVYYGLTALDHRGSGKYVACSASEGKVKCFSGSKESVSSEAASPAVAAVYSDEERDVYADVFSSGGMEVALVADRNSEALEDVGRRFASRLATLGSSAPGRALEALRGVLEELEGEDVPSFIAVTSRGEVLAYRSASGLTPLALGGYGFDLALVSSESRAIDVLGGEVRKWLEPGELLYLHKHLARSVRTRSSGGALCAFELLYMAKHDSLVDGVSVYEFRKRLGCMLAKYLDADVDVVVGVPETAIPYAVGLAQALGKPYEVGFVATGGHQRSALRAEPLQKLIAIHLKMNPVASVLEGKRVLLVDDSMVTGATMKTVSQILRYRVGVEELHVVIASPPLVAECPYKLFPFSVKSLLAANLDADSTTRYLEVDSLTWIKLEDLQEAAQAFGLRFCGKCFGADLVG